MFKIKRLNHLWLQSLLLFFLKFAGQVRLQFAPRRVIGHSIFLVMDCSHTSAPIPSDIPSVFDALDQGIFGVFFLWHFWFSLGLKRFAPSSFSGCSWSWMKGTQQFRDAFKEASCEPSFASLATSFLTCCFYFWPTPLQMTLTGSQMLHIKTRGICSSWEPLVLAVSSPAPLLPHTHSTESFSAQNSPQLWTPIFREK